MSGASTLIHGILEGVLAQQTQWITEWVNRKAWACMVTL